MAARGFRFSILDLESEEFRLTIPYQTMRTVEGGTLTFKDRYSRDCRRDRIILALRLPPTAGSSCQDTEALLA
jgi:hypothetical protein